MIWGAISSRGHAGLWFMPKGTTINGTVYLEILKEKLPPFMELHRTTFFQHDGAPCHNVKAVREWLAQSGFQILGPWPGNSPDLNPIENAWTQVKKQVAAMHPNSLQDMIKAVETVWTQKVSPDYCKKLCRSMPDRIRSVLKNKGKHTKY